MKEKAAGRDWFSKHEAVNPKYTGQERWAKSEYLKKQKVAVADVKTDVIEIV